MGGGGRNLWSGLSALKLASGLNKYWLSNPGSLLDIINAAIAAGDGIDHALSGNLQGGTALEYYHMTAVEYGVFDIHADADADSIAVADNGDVTIPNALNATLATAAQGNITSLGTLTSLAVTNNITVGGTVDGVDIATLKSDYDTLDLIVGGVTAAEMNQIEAIGTVTISNTQWGYLGALNQALGTGDNVEFGVITWTSGSSTNANTAYTHSQVAGGNSVHVSVTENSNWDTAYTHSQAVTGAEHNATLSNTANMIVRRGASGEFSAGVITASLTGNCSGTAATVTGATQIAITTCANLVTVGALNSGSITNGFGTINNGSSSITTTGAVSGSTLTASSKLYINDTSDGNITVGLTINQGTNTNHLMSFKKSNIAHGMTDIMETNSFGGFRSWTTAGGLSIYGLSTSIVGMGFFSHGTTEDTTDTTGSQAGVTWTISKKSGVGTTAYGSTANLMTIRNKTTGRWVIKGDGTVHTAVLTRVQLDDEDDIALTVAAGAMLSCDKDKYAIMHPKMVANLQRVGIINEEGSFYNQQRMVNLNLGTDTQLFNINRGTLNALIGLAEIFGVSKGKIIELSKIERSDKEIFEMARNYAA